MVKALQTYSAVSAAVVAAMAIIGFVVHFRLGHLLGIDLPVVWQGYLEFGGDCLLSVPVALYESVGSFLGTLRGSNLTELVMLGVAFGAFGVTSSYAYCVRRRSAKATSAFRRSALAIAFIACGLFVLQAIALLRFERVLQPWVLQDAPTIHQLQAQLEAVDMSGEAARAVVLQIFDKQAPSMTKTYGEVWKQYFLPAGGVDTELTRRRAYGVRVIALTLLVFALALCRWTSVASPNSVAVTIGALFLLALPITYGTLGRHFAFPVVSLSINQPPHQTNAMYLLSRNPDELVLYDRAAGFKLRRIPARIVDRVDTLGAASPFSSCGAQGGLIPCETLWTATDKQHDF